MTSTVSNHGLAKLEGKTKETQQMRRPLGGFGATAAMANGEQNRTGARSIGNGIGKSSGSWVSGSSTGNIWGSNGYAAGGKSGKQDLSHGAADRFGTDSSRDNATGSGSLLSTSESDALGPHHNPWRASDINDDFPLIPNSSGMSPTSRQNSGGFPSTNSQDNGGHDVLFSSNHVSTPMTSRLSSKIPVETPNEIDPVRSGQNQYFRNFSDDDGRFGSSRVALGPSDFVPDHLSRSVSLSGHNSAMGSRTGSQPPSRPDKDQASRALNDSQPFQSSRYGVNVNAPSFNINANATSFTPQNGPAMEQNSMRLDTISHQLDRLSLPDQRRPSYASSQHSPNSTSEHFVGVRAPVTHNQWNQDDYLHNDPSSPSTNGSYPRYDQPRNGHYGRSAGDNDPRLGQQSPFDSQNGTPNSRHAHPTAAPAPSALNHKLRNLQQQQHGYQHQLSARVPLTIHYDSPQQPYHPNPLASYYPVQPAAHLFPNSNQSQRGSRDPDPSGQLRSALLEDFRSNSKTNKRYDLKDIYEHIVEFSGDQHGSRFIQQKLETANSDEKDQVFRELLPNAFQLMTDVFGNYVIQKFFEHGNQTQKKTLANQMKNRVLALSTQMYGCRVVQKALEHVLTDQQAQLVKELENDVMKCVRDQNGNHVVQKAIERVPAEHIHFIINAFNGKVCENAVHPYGCRVLQRMLEHCNEQTKFGILQELHTCTHNLISDQFGNYVTQHVIQHGRPEDRSKIIHMVINGLFSYSKHKFASNVVEKSVEYGSFDERLQIVNKLTAVNERGESPVQNLIRDQFGNYVVQKLLTHLRGQEWANFAEPVKIQVAFLKKIAYGKQVASVEKLLYRVDPMMGTPPLISDNSLSSSASYPNTHNNSIDFPNDSPKFNVEAPGMYAPAPM